MNDWRVTDKPMRVGLSTGGRGRVNAEIFYRGQTQKFVCDHGFTSVQACYECDMDDDVIVPKYHYENNGPYKYNYRLCFWDSVIKRWTVIAEEKEPKYDSQMACIDAAKFELDHLLLVHRGNLREIEGETHL